MNWDNDTSKVVPDEKPNTYTFLLIIVKNCPLANVYSTLLAF